MDRKKKVELKEYSFRYNLNGYLLIAPAVISILVLSVYPLLNGICTVDSPSDKQ